MATRETQPDREHHELDDDRRYFNLEGYLFDEVTVRFQQNGVLDAFDFFSIVVWKANRAKTKVARRMTSRGKNLEDSVGELTRQIFSASGDRDKLRVLVQVWGFRLPMATSILTVMYPDVFTVYDVRVCNELADFHSVGNRTNFESLWSGYVKYRTTVKEFTTGGLGLRDADRLLWGRSFRKQLERDIAHQFAVEENGSDDPGRRDRKASQG